VLSLSCMKIREIMTPQVQCVRAEDTLVDAASVMRQLDVGVVPVCDDEHVVGILTDRDITVRAVAEGCDPNQTMVSDAMSPQIVCVYDDQLVSEAVQLMELHQIRRTPVINRQERLVGIISLGDIAVAANSNLSAEALRQVSQPAAPVR
jgi:CBS domain-containing protein